MTIYYLDPADEPRECDRCGGNGEWSVPIDCGVEICPDCNGTGQLPGNTDGPKVRITGSPAVGGYRWRWANRGRGYFRSDPYPTEADALVAAREAFHSTDRTQE